MLAISAMCNCDKAQNTEHVGKHIVPLPFYTKIVRMQTEYRGRRTLYAIIA